MTERPYISVIVPVYNEEKFLSQLLKSFLEQDYPQDRMEWIFVDGLSTDNTKEILQNFSRQFAWVIVLDNPDRFVPFALNSAILVSKGKIIIRMDAHSIYPNNYWSVLVEKLLHYQADNVGGVWDTLPGADTTEALAIVHATSHPVGIGNAMYRLGGERDMETDTVPFGCFPKSVFERIGMFDEDLIRNQDDEFNGRIKSNGGKIVLIPSLKIGYYARPTRKKLATMFYQYGLFKPLVNVKLGAPATLRQLAPPLFVLTFAILLLGCLFSGLAQILFVIFTAFYAISISVASLHAIKGSGFGLWWNTAITFPVIHFSYGFGYIFGLLRFTLLRAHKRGKIKISSSR